MYDIPAGPSGQGPDLKLFAAVVEYVWRTLSIPETWLIRDSATFKHKVIFYEDENQSNGNYSAY